METEIQQTENNNPLPDQAIKINQEKDLVKSFNSEGGNMKGKNLKVVLAIFFMVVMGTVSGYFLSTNSEGAKKESTVTSESVDENNIVKGTVVGSEDDSTFADAAEGMLEKGGIDGEGSHHLVRPGGDSQNVYLTSSFIDLDKFAGRKVKVWGETYAAQKAGWLMDVGRLEVKD